MRGRRGPIGAVSAVLLATSTLSAQVPPAPPSHVMLSRAVPPSSLTVGDQYYTADWDGFRKYLDTLRASEPRVYAALSPKLGEIEDQRTLGNIVIWSGIGIGTGLAIWGFSKMATGLDQSECDKLPIGSTERDHCDDQKMEEWEGETDEGLAFVGAGLGVATLGIVGGILLKPGRSELLDLVNEHNRTRPGQPMRLQLGFDPRSPRAHVGLALAFDVAPRAH